MNGIHSAAVELFRSKVAVKLLDALLPEGGADFYVRELARRLNEPVSAVKRELDRLERIGLVVSFRRGRAKHYQANEEASVFSELRGFLLKTSGAERYLRERLSAVPGVQLAFVYGGAAEAPESVVSSIDLMVIGRVGEEALGLAVDEAARTLGRRTTVVTFTPERFAELFKAGDEAIRRAAGGKTRVLIANVPRPKG